MLDSNKDGMLKSLLRSACRPVRASPAFKQKVVNKMMQGQAASTAGTLHILGWSPVTVIVLAIVIAIAMVIYGVLCVPDPSGIIYSAPLPPLD